MPYELTFTKREIEPDAVASRLLPALRERYGEDVEAEPEDWGSYIRLADGDVTLAIDIVAGESDSGAFRVVIASSTKRFAFLKRVEDVPQLEELKRLVAGEIAEWTGKLPDVAPV